MNFLLPMFEDGLRCVTIPRKICPLNYSPRAGLGVTEVVHSRRCRRNSIKPSQHEVGYNTFGVSRPYQALRPPSFLLLVRDPTVPLQLEAARSIFRSAPIHHNIHILQIFETSPHQQVSQRISLETFVSNRASSVRHQDALSGAKRHRMQRAQRGFHPPMKSFRKQCHVQPANHLPPMYACLFSMQLDWNAFHFSPGVIFRPGLKQRDPLLLPAPLIACTRRIHGRRPGSAPTKFRTRWRRPPRPGITFRSASCVTSRCQRRTAAVPHRGCSVRLVRFRQPARRRRPVPDALTSHRVRAGVH